MPLLSDRACADLCAASYAPARDTYGWDANIVADDCRVLIKHLDGFDAVVWPGTEDDEQWFYDFAAIPRTTSHPTLGIVHAGFFIGVEEVTRQVATALRPGLPYVVTGHSLGAAHAWLFAGLRIENADSPARIVVFGSPKPTMDGVLNDALTRKAIGIAMASYRNNPGPGPSDHDRITDLPWTIGPFSWVQPVGLTDIVVPAAPGDTSATLYHHIWQYQRGVTP